jgi:hypothetical protein
MAKIMNRFLGGRIAAMRSRYPTPSARVGWIFLEFYDYILAIAIT